MLSFQWITIVLCITQLTIGVLGSALNRQLVVSDIWNCLPGLEGISQTIATYKNESQTLFANNKEPEMDKFLENFFAANGAFLVYKTACCEQKSTLSPQQTTLVQQTVNDIKVSVTAIIKNAPPAAAPVLNLITSGILSTANQIKQCFSVDN